MSAEPLNPCQYREGDYILAFSWEHNGWCAYDPANAREGEHLAGPFRDLTQARAGIQNLHRTAKVIEP